MARFRLGMKTSQLREVMFSKAEKPAKVYRIKRKTFGVAEAAQNVIGGAAETAGNIADTKVGGTVGGLLAGAKFGGALGSAMGLGALGGPIGWLAAAGLGAMATRAAGKGLKTIGEDIKAD